MLAWKGAGPIDFEPAVTYDRLYPSFNRLPVHLHAIRTVVILCAVVVGAWSLTKGSTSTTILADRKEYPALIPSIVSPKNAGPVPKELRGFVFSRNLSFFAIFCRISSTTATNDKYIALLSTQIMGRLFRSGHLRTGASRQQDVEGRR